jgi:hypothetical protein
MECFRHLDWINFWVFRSCKRRRPIRLSTSSSCEHSKKIARQHPQDELNWAWEFPPILRFDVPFCGDACDSFDFCDPTAIRKANAASQVSGRPLHFNRHGGSPLHFAIAPTAQATVLSRWHEVHGFGILYLSVISGEMKRNVCAWTIAPGTPSPSIAGM